MNSQAKQFFANLVEELGLGEQQAITAMEPLSGGVASDIVRVRIGEREFCLKCALEKLKVAEDWHAPQHRNRAEFAWLEVAARINPAGAVRLLGQSRQDPCFAMEYLAGDDVVLWKTELLQGRISLGDARSVGRAMGRIHAASSAKDFSRDTFHNQGDFYQLRLDPYLRFTATRHPEVAGPLNDLVSRLYTADSVLIHGDISPKNILFRGSQPIFLDAECATMGDASFDVAFCLNHLVLKAIHLSGARAGFLEAVLALWDDYAALVTWEDVHQLESRVCRLLPALMLARVDGKSPVEYLDEPNRTLTRKLALDRIRNETRPLRELIETITRDLENSDQ